MIKSEGFGGNVEGSNPEHYPIADFLKWAHDKELELNPKFQRGSVWVSAARTYLIDSILRGYPIPKILMRTRIDRELKRTIRDVVDGQQRLRTIIDFANGKFPLGGKAGEFAGCRYADLSEELQDRFLSYRLTSEQLMNASDDDVLEVFARINSYTVPVNEPELRNARFDTEFAGLVKSTVSNAKSLWSLNPVSQRDRVRMNDHSLIAEIYIFFVDGIGDGGESRITKFYERMKSATASELPDQKKVEGYISEVVDLLGQFKSERIVQRPHFLILLATLAYMRGDVAPGRIDSSDFPPVPNAPLDEMATVDQISKLNAALQGNSEDEDGNNPYIHFVEAARSSTQRMKSRQVRFEYFYQALSAR
ncbi:DUF262 domain-containing protein [Saccharopolyspora rhizosphaerae]|uniref:DUF262 domain-containing protein n=1 Tax=Saccharopolyspora rhizosphaerae TaxID=2492662 RepID=A0A426JX07_9PSEU|nr:DUF262 domain-containing protein [Saccharopolyspora rhizosphaerae]RRO17633.1 DUF262 domain-containing protein [Saccharopolyspora rhizosphaerae]